MSDTPRTDAAVVRGHINPAMEEVVRASYARELERELARLAGEVARLTGPVVVYSPCKKHIGTPWTMTARCRTTAPSKFVCPICHPPEQGGPPR